ncbi:MAG: S8 family serine peptidase, partial [Hyphomicrobium sp.]
GAMACGDDRCFGRDIIGWKPELHSCVSGVKIGVIDTSIDTSHPAFARKKLELKHFGREGARGPDWHGTGITALLAGDASSGTPGLVPDANFFVADIFHADADNEPASDTVSMLRAFDWLEAKGVKVINMSLSGPADDLIRKAVEQLAAKGILMVAAAGNEGPHAGPSYPAAYDQVIAVTAVSKDLQNYRYANRGSYIDVAAPGVSIWTALPGAQGGYHSGTSFATPYVTAALAAIYPRLAAKTQSEALRMISYKDLGTPGPDPVYGQGLLVAPVTCGAGLIANTPGAKNGLLGGQNAASNTPAPANQPVEMLPWLSFQNSSN